MVRKIRKRVGSLINLTRQVYLISPEKIYRNFYSDLNKVLSSKKVKFFQLRLKNMNEKKIIQIVKKTKKITKKNNVKLIINDSTKITYKTDADGCHLGQLDGNVKIARKYLKKKIIGITCHNSKKMVKIALKNKVQYIALGSFYKSKLKPNAKKVSLKVLKWVRKNTKKPIVVIGGISDKNYKNLIKAGANYIAISSFIWDNPELKPEVAIKKF